MEVVASTLQNFGSNNCFLILAYSSYSSTVPRKSIKQRIEEDQFWRSKHIGLMDPMDPMDLDLRTSHFSCFTALSSTCDAATLRRGDKAAEAAKVAEAADVMWPAIGLAGGEEVHFYQFLAAFRPGNISNSI